MLSLRALLLWLVMLVLPLQGYAAAGMVYCAFPASEAAAAAAMQEHADAHDHASHDQGHGHGTAMQHAKHEDTGHGAAGDADEFHTCGTCAACHANAMVGALPLQPLDNLPRADLAEPFDPPASPSLRVPDKPPRA